jgi:outer membrane protein TolC
MKGFDIKLVIPIFLSLLVFNTGYSQSLLRLTIEEAQDYAFEHNYDLLNAEKDIEIARKQVKEYLSYGYPQLSGTIAYNDYIALPTFLLPEGAMGPDSPQQELQFGTKYNASAEVVLNQIIFDGKYLLGVQASKKILDKTEKEYQKSKLNIKTEVAKAYIIALVAEENNSILDTTLFEMKKMLKETQLTYESGFLEDTDVEQLELIVSDLEASYIFSKNKMDIAYAYLKYFLGLQMQDSVVLTDDIFEQLDLVDHSALMMKGFDFNNNIDYKILKAQEELAVAKLKVEKTEYYPSLSAFLTYQTLAQRNEWNFLSPDEKWYPTSIFGVEMKVPIWSSGTRSNRVQQAKLNLDKIQNMDKQLSTGLNIQVETAKNEFNNAHLVFKNKQKSMGSASNIYVKTAVKYSRGLATSLELLQAHNQFLTTQSEYMVSILDLMETKLDLEQLLTKF